MRLLTLLFCLLMTASSLATPISGPQLMQLVDYVGVDYEEAIDGKGDVINPSEYAEMVEFSATILAAVNALPESDKKATLIAQAEELQHLVNTKASLSAVRVQTHALTEALRTVLNVVLTPTHEPNLAAAKQLYQANCVACHGEKGGGDGVLAKTMDPSPTNFLDSNRMNQLSVFAIYNTITIGVDGTGMASYAKTMTEDERWSLAFYISGLLNSDKTIAKGKKVWESGKQEAVPDLNALTTLRGEQLTAEGSDAQAVMAFLRAHPEVMFSKDPLDIALNQLSNSITRYEKHDAKAAYQYALSAYLDGFETAEAVLDVLDRDKRMLIEQKMMAYREAIKNELPIEDVKAQYVALKDMLTGVQTALPTTEFSNPAVFLSALIILLREGLESILLVGMLIVMLVKAEKKDLLPAVHIGWVLALVAGGLTWWASHTLISISGAAREITEGVTALVAAAMLLYIGVWIHRHQLAHDWRTYLQKTLAKHLTNEARWGLGVLSFLAVYREMFETVLFYEALGLQVGPEGVQMVWLGIVVALAMLLVIVFMMARYGLRLPLQAFFRISAWLIFLFAIVFIGQGIHGLEEAGKVPVWPVPVPTVTLFGIYPNLFGLGLQAIVLAVAVFIGMRKK